MAAYVKYDPFIQFVVNEEVDMFGTTDTFKAVIVRSTDTPVPSGATPDDELADVVQITGTGYTAGGEDTQNDATRGASDGIVTMTMVDITWTATAADWQAAQWVAIHDDTSTTDKLMCYFDYGSVFTVGNGETFTLDFGTNICTIS